MQKKISKLSLLLAAGLYLSACQNVSTINKQQTGTVIGSAVGGILGSQFGKGDGKIAAASLGVLAGGLIGGSIGQSLDQYDKELMYRTSQSALESTPTGQSVKWNNPDSGNYGYVTPTKTTTNGGTVCREYQQKVTIGGKTQNAYGTACRQSDGSWRIVK